MRICCLCCLHLSVNREIRMPTWTTRSSWPPNQPLCDSWRHPFGTSPPQGSITTVLQEPFRSTTMERVTWLKGWAGWDYDGLRHAIRPWFLCTWWYGNTQIEKRLIEEALFSSLCHLKRSLGPVVQLVSGDSATIFIDTEFKGNLSDMKTADYKKTFYRALTLKGSGSLQGLSIGKVTDLEGAPGYKLVTKLQNGRKMPRAMDLSWRRCWDNLLKPMNCWFSHWSHWSYHC